jgi:hypothetical protein
MKDVQKSQPEGAHAMAYGLAFFSVATELLKALIDKNVISPFEVQKLLEDAGQDLVSKRTDVAVAAATQVSLLGKAVGVTPSQIGSHSN